MENPILQIVTCIFLMTCVLCLVLYIVVILTINRYATEPVMLQAPPNMVSAALILFLVQIYKLTFQTNCQNPYKLHLYIVPFIMNMMSFKSKLPERFLLYL
jgi:glucan phosphoethanolaminetransferase (alkaline phosphatase superfamily)